MISNYPADLYAGLYREAYGEKFSPYLDAVLSQGIPSRKQEAYKYFSLRELSRASYSGHAAQQGFDSFAEDSLPQMNLAETNLVFVNGRFYGIFGAQDSSITVEIVQSLESIKTTAFAKDDDFFLPSLLNAFHGDVTKIIIAAKAKNVKIVLHDLLRAEISAFSINRVQIQLEDASDLLLQIKSDASATGSHHSLSHLELTVGHAASCRVFSDYSNHTQGYALRYINATIAAAANCKIASVTYGRSSSRCNTRIKLLGEEAQCGLYGLVYAQDEDLFDHHTHITHAASNTSSRQVYKMVGHGASRTVFNGRIHVVPGVAAIDAQQQVRGMLGSDSAEIDAKPDLRIEADDVKCSHGASIGGLNPDQLFYLLSRGIDEPQAKAFLARGFLNDLIERLPDSDLQMLFKDSMDLILGGGGQSVEN